MTWLIDDGIVVVEVRKVRAMGATVRVLRERLGHDGMADLHVVVDEAGVKWKEEMLSIAAERFERRMAEEFGALRVEMAKDFAAVRLEISSVRTDVLKWAFVFWIGQVAAMSGIMAFLLRTMVPR